MNSERWQRVQRLFEEALAQPVETRRAFILSACGPEVELRDEVLSLLNAHEQGQHSAAMPRQWLGALGGGRPAGSGDGPELAGRLNAALIGRYAIQRELGSGAMATVFLAEDLRHRRKVAIKVLHRELAAVLGRERFLREIEIAAGLSHPHILPLYDSGAAEGLLYFVMPYAEGESLRDRLAREKQLPLDLAVRLTREVADALEYAHRQGIVHRDIKPENILFVDQHAVVADFGIARAMVAAGGDKLTATGVTVGTPAYMSPEQVAGRSDVDGRSDQYSLGCVLYEMLAGHPPFTGPTAESLAHQHLSVQPRPVAALRPTVPASLERVLAKALAKGAADRYSSTAQFATALTPTGEQAPVTAPAGTSERTVGLTGAKPGGGETGTRRRRLVLAGVGAAIMLVAIGLAWRWEPLAHMLGGRSMKSAPSKAWILVAEFDGPAADSSVVAATRDLVMAALDQSEIVATVPADQIRLALQSAGKPASTRVEAELARELAYRSAVRTVLEGRVGRLGSGYSVVLRVVDADSGRVVLSLSDAARSEQALIPTVGRIARKLRAELGERRRAIEATRELTLAMTPSLEAYKTWLKARDLGGSGDDRAAITVARAALALDPDFGAPWSGIGYYFANLWEPDSALDAFHHALAHPERLTLTARLNVEAMVASLNGDNAGALALKEQMVQLNPQDPTAQNNWGSGFDDAGRTIDALERYRTADNISPFGASQVVLSNEFRALLALGRVDEARALLPRLEGNLALQSQMEIAAAAGRWSAAESLATVIPAADRSFQAAAQASRGEVRAADQTLRQVQSEAETTREWLGANSTRWDRLSLALFSRGVAADPGSPGSWDSTTAGLVVHGAWAAAMGDTILARRLQATIRKRSAIDLAWQGFFGRGMVDAWLAARTGHWQEVLRLLGPAAMQGQAPGYVLVQSAPLLRWLVAEAYERLDRPDSAAAYFERAIAPVPEGGLDFVDTRMAFSFGHRRLVLLYARMGRLEEARRHWEIFSATFTRPDPEMKPLVEEARAALASATGMAKTARR